MAFRAKYYRNKRQMILESKQETIEMLVKYIIRIQNMGLRERPHEEFKFSTVTTGIRPSLKPIIRGVLSFFISIRSFPVIQITYK